MSIRRRDMNKRLRERKDKCPDMYTFGKEMHDINYLYVQHCIVLFPAIINFVHETEAAFGSEGCGQFSQYMTITFYSDVYPSTWF